MVEFTLGDILEFQGDALVNPVNTMGVMGKGLALKFKEAFPKNFVVYRQACAKGQVRLGKVHATQIDDIRIVVNFPTKGNWRNPSKIEWIQSGLADLKKFCIERRIVSVALPKLGCGLGGLDWPLVKKEIEECFFDTPEIKVVVYQ